MRVALSKAAVRLCDRWSRSRDMDILRLLRPDQGSRVVDLGCGDGAFTQRVLDRVGCDRIHGVDQYGPFVAQARARGVEVTECDLDRAPYPLADGSFDVVVANQVIEHLLYPARFVKEIHRILRPGGYAILSTENLSSWDNVLALLLGFTPFSMEFDEGFWKIGNPLSPHAGQMLVAYAPHARIFTLRGLGELARRVGFKVEAARGHGHPLGRAGNRLDRRHCRFITLLCRKDHGSPGIAASHA